MDGGLKVRLWEQECAVDGGEALTTDATEVSKLLFEIYPMNLVQLAKGML